MSEFISLLDVRFALITKELSSLVSDGQMPECVFSEDSYFDHKLIFARLCSIDVDFYLSAYSAANSRAYVYAHNKGRSIDSDFGAIVIKPDIINHYCNSGLDIHDIHLESSWSSGISLDEALECNKAGAV